MVLRGIMGNSKCLWSFTINVTFTQGLGVDGTTDPPIYCIVSHSSHITNLWCEKLNHPLIKKPP